MNKLENIPLVSIPEYNAWRNMRQRCLNKKNPIYKYYGKRGITFDKTWDSFFVFLKDVGVRPSNDFELDRIDVNGNYCKENCRWVSKKEQQRNLRRTRFLAVNGVSKRIVEWAEELHISDSTVRKRLARGCTPERAISTRNHKFSKNISICR